MRRIQKGFYMENGAIFHVEFDRRILASTFGSLRSTLIIEKFSYKEKMIRKKFFIHTVAAAISTESSFIVH